MLFKFPHDNIKGSLAGHEQRCDPANTHCDKFQPIVQQKRQVRSFKGLK